MSQIPYPPALPKPKSLSKGNDAATLEHDALLRIVWRHLNGIVKVLYSRAQTKCADSAQSAVDGYLSVSASAAERARKLAQDFGADPRAADASALAGRLSSVERSFVPAVTGEMLEPIIERRTLTAPLEEHKTVGGRERVTHVGFVDIACQVSIPRKLTLYDGLPWFIRPDSMFALSRRSAQDVSVKEIQEAPPVPHWTVDHETRSFWVDVRVKPLPLGQLLRELKTLRSYSRFECVVCVVMPSIDEETRAFLADEGFLPLTTEWLTSHGFV